MIYTPKIKYKKLLKKHHSHIQSLYYLGFVLLFALCMVLIFIAEPASGEAPTIAPVVENTEKVSIATPEPKTSHIAVLGQPSPIEIKGSVDKEAIKALIMSEAEKAGYQAPLFAIRVAQCESSLNPSAVGDHGQSYGMWQIHLPSHPDITKEQALDPEWSTKWAMEQMAAGRARIWTCARILS